MNYFLNMHSFLLLPNPTFLLGVGGCMFLGGNGHGGCGRMLCKECIGLFWGLHVSGSRKVVKAEPLRCDGDLALGCN